MIAQPSILLIEDEPYLLHNLQMLLQNEGYRVIATCDSAEGIKQLEAQGFDLVITDLVMPGIDGFQILDYLQTYRPETVVVAMTGYISPESAIEAQRRGVYGYITKPFDYGALKTAIARALEKACPHKRPGSDAQAGPEGGGRASPRADY
jgi:DNA-binding NtrC family response regulator